MRKEPSHHPFEWLMAVVYKRCTALEHNFSTIAGTFVTANNFSHFLVHHWFVGCKKDLIGFEGKLLVHSEALPAQDKSAESVIVKSTGAIAKGFMEGMAVLLSWEMFNSLPLWQELLSAQIFPVDILCLPGNTNK